MFLDEIPESTRQFIKVGKYATKAAKILAKTMAVPAAPTITAGACTELAESEKEYLKEIIKDFKLSPTALNSYLNCAYKFKLDNLYRIPRTKAAPMCFGTAVHSALQNLYIDLANDKKLPSKESFVEDFITALRREVLSAADYKNYLEKGQTVLSAFYDNYKDTFAPALFTEKKFGSSLTSQIFLGDIPLSGKADRIDLVSPSLRGAEATKQSHSTKDVRFIDYKTGHTQTRNEIEGKTQSSDGDYKRQLVFYQLLADLDRSFGYKVVETELQFIEADKGGKFHQERFIITPEEVSDLKKLIRATMSAIRALSFDRTTDYKHCDRCEFLSHCWPAGIPKTTSISER
jgi:DNA helicase-2/ATP-dependent DNA helicase PcrA